MFRGGLRKKLRAAENVHINNEGKGGGGGYHEESVTK